MWTIALPLRVLLPRKTKADKPYLLNLNVYRNTHPHVLNQAKVIFAELTRPLVEAAGVPKLERCTLEYILYPGSARECDVNNICTIVDKFFSDALVSCGVLEDDNYKFLADIRSRFGAIDRSNPRVEVVIRSPDHIPTVHPEPLQESPEPMKITNKITTTAQLSVQDVESALRAYLLTQIYDPIAADAKITMKEQKDGSYEVTIEQNVEVTSGKPEKESKPKKKTEKPERLEPKEAMEALQSPQPVLPGFARVHSVADQGVGANVLQAPAQAATVGLPLVGEEKGHVETKPSTSASQEIVAPSQEEKTPVEAPPPKAPSLFANFTRPSNP